MKSHTNKKTSVAVLNSVVAILVMLTLQFRAAAGETISQPLHPEVCRVVNFTSVGEDKTRITFVTLNNDDTWSCKKETMIPHTDHFIGEIFIGAQAPKGWIIFDRYSKINSARYVSYIEKIRPADGEKKIALQRRLFELIERQKKQEAKELSTVAR